MTEPARPLIDPEVFADLRSIGDDVITDVYGAYLSDVPDRLAALAQALRDADLNRATTLAHTLKGASGSIGAMPAAEAFAALERAGRAGDDRALAEQWPETERIARDTVEVVRELLPS